jgi:uncharacterized protein YpuA (DUF1002 family)
MRNKEYVKEFVLRLSEEEAQELEKLQVDTGQSHNQSNAVRIAIMNHRHLKRELGNYKMELTKTQEELSRLKQSLKSYFQLETNIKAML